mmetsp:Transcript_24982/g.59452  ORF Transcript_24982/g.59452 Transcript_24982/m.59452 type:complete len:427 (+) Transcript_24982:180-1460(+)
MLSQPRSGVFVSGARHRSQSCSHTVLGSPPERILSRTNATTSWFDITSHTPSHASTMNSSPSLSSSSTTSGTQLTSCSSGRRPSWPLNSRSPRARERLSEPLILPSHTKPPALLILSSSAGSEGLWSRLMGSTTPARLRTHLESPALATQSRRPSTSATTAVHPADGICGSSGPSASSASLRGNAPLSSLPLLAGSSPGGALQAPPSASSRPGAAVFRSWAQVSCIGLGAGPAETSGGASGFSPSPTGHGFSSVASPPSSGDLSATIGAPPAGSASAEQLDGLASGNPSWALCPWAHGADMGLLGALFGRLSVEPGRLPRERFPAGKRRGGRPTEDGQGRETREEPIDRPQQSGHPLLQRQPLWEGGLGLLWRPASLRCFLSPRPTPLVPDDTAGAGESPAQRAEARVTFLAALATQRGGEPLPGR